MNFYAHVAIASLYTEQLETVLGAMLPDLASLIGARLPPSTDPRIVNGCDLHHATDRVFHQTELFRRACAIESLELRARGLARAPAKAAAHVGLELLLDQVLIADEPTHELFRLTLAAAHSDDLSNSILWTSPRDAKRFAELRQRLGGYPSSWSEHPSTLLAERVCRTLSQRPRLAVRASDRASLDSWSAGLGLRNDSIWPKLVEEVVRGLEGAAWHVRPDLARQLRFQRAWGGQV